MSLIRSVVLASILFSAVSLAEKIEVTSNSMKALEKEKKIRFIGDAKVTQKENWIKADEIIVYFDENNETKKYEAVGNALFFIRQNSTKYKGKAKRVVYLPKQSEYVLSGDAQIEDITNDRRLNGDMITLNAATGGTKVESKGRKPVKFIFDTEKKGE